MRTENTGLTLQWFQVKSEAGFSRLTIIRVIGQLLTWAAPTVVSGTGSHGLSWIKGL